MSKKNKEFDYEEGVMTEVNDVTVSSEKTGFKKHGKKIAAVAAIAGTALLVAILKKKKSKKDQGQDTIHIEDYGCSDSDFDEED